MAKGELTLVDFYIGKYAWCVCECVEKSVRVKACLRDTQRKSVASKRLWCGSGRMEVYVFFIYVFGLL